MRKIEDNSLNQKVKDWWIKNKITIPIVLAYMIPLMILVYFLYINYLPFGWEKTYEITINENGTIHTSSAEIYLEDSNKKHLLSLPEVSGEINLVLEPRVTLKESTINISLNSSDGVYIPALPDDLSEINWDYNWDFDNKIPQEFNGTAKFNEQEECTYFNSSEKETLSLPNSQNLFENKPMSIYVKWKPLEDNETIGKNQQIIGHYNWEIYQDNASVRFQIGRMNNNTGQIYLVNYPINNSFFNEEHNLLAIYQPDKINGTGYVELFVDGAFAQRKEIGKETIYQDYNSDKPLSTGWSSHNYGNNSYFEGCLYKVKISNTPIVLQKTAITFESNLSKPIKIPIEGYGNIRSIIATISK